MAKDHRLLSIAQSYNLRSDFAKIIYDQLLQAYDPRTANFFQRHGLVTKTVLNQECDTPIQCVDNFECVRVDKLTVHIPSIMHRDPTVGARTPAVSSDHAHPLTTFEFKTVVMFSQSLNLPTTHKDYVVPISTFMCYGKQLRNFWEQLIENAIWAYSAGITRAINNLSSLGSGEMEHSFASMFIKNMNKLHELNPITSPSDKWSTWDTENPKAGATIDPAGATEKSNLMLSDINHVYDYITYIKKRKVGKLSIDMEKPMINVHQNIKEGSKQSGGMLAWLWVITPEIAFDLRNLAAEKSNDTLVGWGSDQIACTEGEQTKNVYDNSYIGRLNGFIFAQSGSLPRYRGGAGSYVPICRSIIFGKQAVAYGFRRNLKIGKRYTKQLNSMGPGISFNGVRYSTLTDSQCQNNVSILQSSCDFGVRKICYPDWNDPHIKRDRGIMTVDIPYTAHDKEEIDSLPTLAEAEKSLGI